MGPTRFPAQFDDGLSYSRRRPSRNARHRFKAASAMSERLLVLLADAQGSKCPGTTRRGRGPTDGLRITVTIGTTAEAAHHKSTAGGSMSEPWSTFRVVDTGRAHGSAGAKDRWRWSETPATRGGL